MDQPGASRGTDARSRQRWPGSASEVSRPSRSATRARLAGSLAWLECEVAEVYHGGDHSIFLGTVLDATGGSGEALVFFDGDFHQGKLAPRSA